MKTAFRIASVFLALSMCVHACWFTEENLNRFYIYGVNSNAVHYNPMDWVGLNYVRYYNGMDVSFPITPFVKIERRYPEGDYDYDGEFERDLTIKIAMLRCRVFRNVQGSSGYHWSPATDWKVLGYYVKKSYYQDHIEAGDVANLDMMPDKYNPSSGACESFPTAIDFEMEYEAPVALFGTDILTVANVGIDIRNGDAIVFEYYLSDGLYETGNLEHGDEEVTPATVLDVEGIGNIGEFDGSRSIGDRTTFMPPFVFVVKYRSKNKILNPDEAPIWRR